MHICFLCSEYPPGLDGVHGGIGSFTQTLARELVGQGHKATVVGLYPDKQAGTEDDAGVRVVRVPKIGLPVARWFLNGMRLRRRLAALHRETPFDVVEGAELSFALIPSNFPAPKVLRMHGGHHFFSVMLGAQPERWLGWQEKRSFRVANHLCGVSNFVSNTTRRLLHLNGRPIEVIANPVDLSMFRPKAPELEEDGLLLFIGTIVEKKGIRQLIEAMPLILKAVPNARLEVYGGDTRDSQSGVSFTGTLQRSLSPECAGRVLFQGKVPRERLPEVMARASVCVYPSHMEAMPIAWIEGLAMGKAVVASQTGPGPEVVEDGVSGLMCDPHDPQSIARQVIRLLQDAGLRRKLGAMARNLANERFSLPVLLQHNLEYYRECARKT